MNADERLRLERIRDDVESMLAVDAPPTILPWFDIANRELGVREIRGPEHNPRVLEYHASTGLSADDDETPWCSSFVNWCFEQCGMVGTNSARARSWLDWGQRVGVAVPGCVVVFSRPPKPSSGHVAFFVGRSNGGDTVRVLGGNQGNAVSIREYPISRVIDFRMPL